MTTTEPTPWAQYRAYFYRMEVLLDPTTGKLLYFAPPDVRICLRFLHYHWWRIEGRFVPLNDGGKGLLGLRMYARTMMRGRLGWKKWLAQGVASEQLWVHHHVFLNHAHIRASFDKFCTMTSAYTDVDPDQWPEPTLQTYTAAERGVVARSYELPMRSTETSGKARTAPPKAKAKTARPKKTSASAIQLIKSNMNR